MKFATQPETYDPSLKELNDAIDRTRLQLQGLRQERIRRLEILRRRVVSGGIDSDHERAVLDRIDDDVAAVPDVQGMDAEPFDGLS